MSTNTSKTTRRVTGQAAQRANLWGWFFTAPFAVVFVVFLIVPMVYAFYVSLYSYTQVRGTVFTGISNYARAFKDPIFLQGMGRVLLYTAVMVPIQIILALIFALIIDAMRTKFAAGSRLAIFLPYAVPGVIGALMWGFLYSKDMGPFASIFELFGMQAPAFLSPQGLFGSLVNVVTWQWTGYYMVIIYSALQSIPHELYESARIDGASELQIALRIKTPMVSSSLVMATIFALIGTLQFYTEPMVLRNNAQSVIPPEYTPNMYAYTLAFNYNQVNYSATVSFALGLIVVIISVIFMRITRKQSGLGE